jgi:hypothetical protein
MVDTNEIEGFNDVAVTDDEDPGKHTRIVPENAAKFIEVLREKVCLCQPCRIWLLGCNVGLGDIPEKLHDASQCTVYGPKGYIDQAKNPSNPVGLARSISTRKGDEYPPYPGAEARFGVYPPPPEKPKK